MPRNGPRSALSCMRLRPLAAVPALAAFALWLLLGASDGPARAQQGQTYFIGDTINLIMQADLTLPSGQSATSAQATVTETPPGRTVFGGSIPLTALGGGRFSGQAPLSFTGVGPVGPHTLSMVVQAGGARSAPATVIITMAERRDGPVMTATPRQTSPGQVAASVSCEPANVHVGDTVVCDANVVETDAHQPNATHVWQFGDGGSAATNPANHIYQTPGHYTVTYRGTFPLSSSTPANLLPSVLTASGTTTVDVLPVNLAQPAAYDGRATVNGRPAREGAVVVALIGGRACSDPAVVTNGMYHVVVPPDSVRPGCGTPGATVTFTIDGTAAAQSASWSSGSTFAVDLTVGQAQPTVIPTAAPTAVTPVPTASPVRTATPVPTAAPTVAPTTAPTPVPTPTTIPAALQQQAGVQTTGAYSGGAQQMTVGRATSITLTGTITNPLTVPLDYTHTVVYEAGPDTEITNAVVLSGGGSVTFTSRNVTWGGPVLDPGQSATIQIETVVTPTTTATSLVILGGPVTTATTSSGQSLRIVGAPVTSSSIAGLLTAGAVAAAPVAAPAPVPAPAPAPAANLPRAGAGMSNERRTAVALGLLMAATIAIIPAARLLRRARRG